MASDPKRGGDPPVVLLLRDITVTSTDSDLSLPDDRCKPKKQMDKACTSTSLDKKKRWYRPIRKLYHMLSLSNPKIRFYVFFQITEKCVFFNWEKTMDRSKTLTILSRIHRVPSPILSLRFVKLFRDFPRTSVRFSKINKINLFTLKNKCFK